MRGRGYQHYRDLGRRRRAGRGGDGRGEGHGRPASPGSMSPSTSRWWSRRRGRTDSPAGRRHGAARYSPSRLSDAIVVGSGPNGLACAVELARNGVAVTVIEAEEPDRRRHADQRADRARAAPRRLLGHASDGRRLAVPQARWIWREHGLEWRWPEVDLAHPLDDGSAGVMVRSIEETARGLGEDGDAWRRVFGSASAHFEELLEDMLRADPPRAAASAAAGPVRASGGGRPRHCSPVRGRRRRRGRCSAGWRRTRSLRSAGR